MTAYSLLVQADIAAVHCKTFSVEAKTEVSDSVIISYFVVKIRPHCHYKPVGAGTAGAVPLFFQDNNIYTLQHATHYSEAGEDIPRLLVY